jgi:acid phosphatase (class A)
MNFHRSVAHTALCVSLSVVAFAPASAEEHHLHYLPAGEIQPSLLLPDPVAEGSPAEKAEIGDLHALIAASSPERIAQAKWDDQHEDPSLYDAMLGLKLETLPTTWALLKAVQNEGDAAADVTKIFFHRKRPWAVDPSMPRCDGTSTASPYRSYPSGHSTLGYTTGFILARLLPGRAQLILDRSADYAQSRRICGVHYPSDTEASHVLGTYVATRLMANPSFLKQFEAARAELKAAHVAGA